MLSKSAMKKFVLNQDKKIDTGFVVPNSYFDDLPERVVFQVNQPVTRQFFSPRKFLYAAAAVLVVSLMLTLLFKNNLQPAVDDEAIEQYLVHAMTDEDISMFLEEQDLADLENEHSIDDQELEQYLYESITLEHLE